jgi:uncharacterized protein (DUF924 family)
MSDALPAAAQSVLDFWFGPAGSPERESAREVWWRKDAAFDATIRLRFGALVDAAVDGGLRDWDATDEGALARVIVLDQFTRNIHRGTARAFAGDAFALQAARAMVAAGRDRTLRPRWRAFAYMPFEHAEELAAQDEAVRLFAALEAESPAGELEDDMLDYALRHRAIVARFGRFPHRNAALGRASTAEEIEFLKEPGSSF